MDVLRSAGVAVGGERGFCGGGFGVLPGGVAVHHERLEGEGVEVEAGEGAAAGFG